MQKSCSRFRPHPRPAKFIVIHIPNQATQVPLVHPSYPAIIATMPGSGHSRAAARGDRGGRMSPVETSPEYWHTNHDEPWWTMMLKMVQTWVVIFSNFFRIMFYAWDDDPKHCNIAEKPRHVPPIASPTSRTSATRHQHLPCQWSGPMVMLLRRHGQYLRVVVSWSL